MNTNAIHVNSKRNNFIDFVKGILICLVVWGHTIQYFLLENGSFYEDIVYKIIYSFHMPLFMVISGYVFYWSVSRTGLLKIIKKEWSLLVCQCFFGD